MDSSQVGVFKQPNQVGFTCFLQSTNSCTLEVQICLEVLSNFSHQMLEGKFANQFSGFLITTTFTECHQTRPAMMRFLHLSSRGWTLARGFCSHLPPRCFTTGRFPGSLLCRRHGTETSILTYPTSWLEFSQLEAALVLREPRQPQQWWLRTSFPNINLCDLKEADSTLNLSNTCAPDVAI